MLHVRSQVFLLRRNMHIFSAPLRRRHFAGAQIR